MNHGFASSPRVLFVCDFHLRYGAMLAAGLDRAGADVTLLSRDHDLEFGETPGAATEFVRDAAGPDLRLLKLGGRVRSPRGWRQAIALRRGIHGRGPGFVHLQESVGNDPRLLVAAGVRRGRYALTVHDPVPHPGDRVSALNARMTRAVVRGAGLIFVHAEALREELIEAQRPPGAIVVVPHGIDSGTTTPLPEHPAVLFFGRISHYKGLDVLLEAMESVWRSLPEATLTIAGAGNMEPHRALADPRVTARIGHVPESEVPGLIEAAGCVVLPYRQASQSGVGSLVKPYARPLVVTAVGGLPELVADGSGHIVPPEDPGRLAEALVSVLSDRESAQRMGAAGAATAAREGSWDVVAERTLAAYREHLPSSA